MSLLKKRVEELLHEREQLLGRLREVYVGQELTFLYPYFEMPSRPNRLGYVMMVKDLILSDGGEILLNGYLRNKRGQTIAFYNYVPLGYFKYLEPCDVSPGHTCCCVNCGAIGRFDPGRKRGYMGWVEDTGCYQCARAAS